MGDKKMIVVDECLGLYEKPQFLGDETLYFVNLIKAGQADRGLQKQVERTKPRNILPSIKLKRKTLSDEIDFFTQVVHLNSAKQSRGQTWIFYFYHSYYTDNQIIRKIQSLLLPEVFLLPIPVNASRAKALYMMYVLDRYIRQSHQNINFSELNFGINKSVQDLSCYLLSPKPLAQFKPHKWRYVYKHKQNSLFKLVHMKADGQVNLVDVDELQNLWPKVLSFKSEQKELWAVVKDLDDGEKAISGTDFLYHIEQPAIPVNVPVIDVAIYSK
ncbi:hypothetical protein J2S00_000664 [Caldalkalibacillus uzonensis]|uniref:DUF4130 domain-containing protein n=2 Tax=Caldalkalibacillus uzonensis TaxID=353224 RepID=A0ABU0CN87_9BACI|nr:hypothetical protein [Caldalkalibacillus uzonensis]